MFRQDGSDLTSCFQQTLRLDGNELHLLEKHPGSSHLFKNIRGFRYHGLDKPPFIPIYRSPSFLFIPEFLHLAKNENTDSINTRMNTWRVNHLLLASYIGLIDETSPQPDSNIKLREPVLLYSYKIGCEIINAYSISSSK